MKGLLYKNYLVTRKFYLIALLFFCIMALFMILIRLSMICGNISHDPETVEELSRTMWIFRYMPCSVILLSFSGYEGTVFTDLEAGWTKFSRTTSLSPYKIVGAYFLSKGIVLMVAYILCLLYLVIFCLSFGDEISLHYIGHITALFFLGLAIQYYNLLCYMFVNKAQTAQTIQALTGIIVAAVFNFYIYAKIDELQENPDIGLLEWLAQQFAPLKEHFFLISLLCAVIFTVGGYFLSVKGLERRKF